jgi:hypothetical protein
VGGGGGSSNSRFYQNPSSGSRVLLCGQTDMTKLLDTFCNSANLLKNKRKEICSLKVEHETGKGEKDVNKST